MFEALDHPLAIVAHDAGAANQIIAWAKSADLANVKACLAGPALALWPRAFPSATSDNLAGTLAGSRTLVSGTGWASDLEYDARKLARSLGITTIAVIDHWTNYRDRFVRGGDEVLPDQIWVTDEFARALAQREFSGIEVVQMPNLYLDQLVRDVVALEAPGAPRVPENVLYALEPIRDAWGPVAKPGEFLALDFFVANLPSLRLGSGASIRLRPHPSDPVGKYDAWIAAHPELEISLDTSDTLAGSIAWSGTVVGCQTYAMVLALAAGRRVFSSIPPWAPPCVLPQPEIVRLSDVER